MPIELTKLIEQFRKIWGGLPARRRAMLIVAVVATLGVIGFVTARPGGESYTTLYGDLKPENARRVIEALKSQNIPYRVEGEGAGIAVPTSRVYETRIDLVDVGSHGGTDGFSIFDHQAFGIDRFTQATNYQRALQGELARTIMSLDPVKEARVLLNRPERSIYTKEDEGSTASVSIQLKPGRSLSPPQVKGVALLVSASVERLRPEAVTIIDESGALIWPADEGKGGGSAGDEEQTRIGKLKPMLDRYLGAGHYALAVTVEMDHAKVDHTDEIFLKDATVPVSEIRVEERGLGGAASGPSGVAGATGNLPGAPAPTPGGPGPGQYKSSVTVNNQVGRKHVRTTDVSDRIKQIHVALLVDANPRPRTPDELKALSSAAAQAAGMDPGRGDRIEVQSLAFASTGAPLPPAAAADSAAFKLPFKPLYTAIGAGALLFVIIAGSLFRRRRAPRQLAPALVPALPLSASAFEQAISAPAATAALEPPSSLPALPEKTPRERAVDAVRSDAAKAAKVISSWLADATPATRSAP